MPSAVSAFDAIAADYDASFTGTAIGARMRQAVWRRCAARFAPGSRVLEMNCGTGEDALWMARRGVEVLATDISPQMLRQAEAKAANYGASVRLQFRPLAWEDLGSLDGGPFDGLFSNFGGLNCVTDLDLVARSAAGRLRSGGVAMLCIMGPVVPWEWIWFGLRGEPKKAFRRLRRGGAEWSGIPIRYPSIGRVRRAFSRDFRTLRVSAIGALLPPPYTEPLLGRFPALIRVFDAIERRCESVWPLPYLADHYLLELERR
ncbi:MAG TPA: class I SAM-dependent methyltransferase [Bryobacteraceae bacterium]|nr:class I SAM-dependent methyltransferase [Bryobacteraceae bacterium]